MLLTPPDLLPPNEAERLLTLHYYNVVTSLQEPVFEEFVGLAVRLFNLPISLLTFIDADEAVYRAAYGMPNLTHQARSEAICSIAVARSRVVVFTDLEQPAQRRQLTAAATAVARIKGLQFYAGVPLLMPNQCAIGTFCIIDRQPRAISPQELQVLEQLGHLIEKVVVVRHACLESKWLGTEHWRLVQAYITDRLRDISALVCCLTQQVGAQVPVLPTVLIAAIQRLNSLSSVLAEPLPGFA